jgi:hypothetical protein
MGAPPTMGLAEADAAKLAAKAVAAARILMLFMEILLLFDRADGPGLSVSVTASILLTQPCCCRMHRD